MSGRRREDRAPCGTPAAYQRHYRNREPICAPCRVANAAALAARRRAAAAIDRQAAEQERLYGADVRALVALLAGLLREERRPRRAA